MKIAKGTFRPGRANHQQPKTTGQPMFPFKRGTITAAKWREVVTGLKRQGIIDQVDGTHITLADADTQARELKSGLWSSAHGAILPWDWRKMSKDERDEFRWRGCRCESWFSIRLS